MRAFFIISFLILSITSYGQISSSILFASNLSQTTNYNSTNNQKYSSTNLSIVPEKNTIQIHSSYSKNTPENCIEAKPPKLCYTFSEENPPIDTLVHPIKYRWRTGNGYVSWGQKIHYCYLSIGNYTIHLDYIDTLTGIEYNDVGTYHLEIKPNNTLSIVFPDSITQGETVTIKYKNFLNTTENESPIWSINDSQIGEGKSIDYQFQEIGKHHIILNGIPNYTQNDSSNCTFKNIYILPNEDTIKNKNQVDLIFGEDDNTLSNTQIQALTYFVKNNSIDNHEIYLKKTEYASNKEDRKIEQKIEDFFEKNGVPKTKLHFVNNLKISSSSTKYKPKRVTISLKNL